jgi:hypothetical protein
MADQYVDAVEYFKGEDGWHYRSVSNNGDKLNVSEAYSDKTEARTAADKFAEQLNVDVFEVDE